MSTSHNISHHWTQRIKFEHKAYDTFGCLHLDSTHLSPVDSEPVGFETRFYDTASRRHVGDGPIELDLSALDLDAVRLTLPDGYVLRRTSRGVADAEQQTAREARELAERVLHPIHAVEPTEPGEACRYCGTSTRALRAGYCPSCATAFAQANT